MDRYLLNFDLQNLPAEETETIVIGSGLAGISTALQLTNLGIKPLIVSKKPLKESNSFLAQGGIAAAVGKDDDTDLHFLDTINAGKGLCIDRNVRILVEEGVERVVDLITKGVPFDRNESGEIKLTREAAHSKNRVLHVKDQTGKEIGKTLWNILKDKKVKLENEYILEEILTDENKFVGVIVSNKEKLKFIKAKSIVIATGGYSPLYLRNTSAYKISGDAISIAYRAGCILKDMEFIQFHPTSINIPDSPAYLISEAVRGEGAFLVDEDGNRFIDELSPRDEVARAIFNKEKEGKKVFLDISPILQKNIDFKKRFPTIYKLLKHYNLENETKIPVSPAAHYSIGGIEAQANGKTNVEGIFAVGEASCTGVHGANRLASNSLLECVVFGFKTAYSVYIYNMHNSLKGDFNVKNKINLPDKKMDKNERHEILYKIKKTMWEKVGLIRNEENLYFALNDIESIENLLNKYQNNKYLKELVILSKAVIKTALNRKESRGVHYRSDYPQEYEEYKKHSKIKENFKIKLEVK
jgi:L-aspartate oxidase